MKKLFLLTILLLTFAFASPTLSFAQGMMGGSDEANAEVSDGHTAREEAEGKAVWEKLQAKELTCEDLNDDDFGALGEYFMGQMAGKQHESMNNMMIQMMGEEGEEQMHIAMGKRMSGCEPDAPMPQNMGSSGMMSMMMNMMGGGGTMGSFVTNPTGWSSWGLGSWLITLTWIIWLIVGVLATTWLWKQIRKE